MTTPLNDGGDNTGVLVLVAAHDEARRIGATLAALREAFPAASLWVADDGSRDATAEIAREGGASVVGMERRVGKGEAVSHALRLALSAEDRPPSAVDRAQPADDRRLPEADEEASGPAGRLSASGAGEELVVLLCDGDLGAGAARLTPLVAAVESGEADLAVAAFATRIGGGFGIAVRFARWSIARRCGIDAKAPLCGQRAFRARDASKLLPFAPGYGMELGMTIDAGRAGMRYRETELDLEHRATGRTPAGFAHRARQLLHCVRAHAARR